jgi:hypothetical protein
VEIVVAPAVTSTKQRALLLALERTGVRRPGAQQDHRTWWRTGLREAVEGDELDAGYAFSPRNTRGATRA